MKKIILSILLIISIKVNSQLSTCFSTVDGVDNSSGWSYKDYVIPQGYKVDSVYGDFSRPGYSVSAEDFILKYCQGTSTFDNGISVSPFNYQTINTSLYNQWIDLTSYNYESTGVIRVYLPVNAGAVWNNLCFSISTITSTTNIKTINLKKLLIYPNPSNDIVNIDNGDYALMNGYSIKIINALGQEVYSSSINSQLLQVSVNQLGSVGNYFINIYDNQSQLIESKVLVLE